MLLHITYTYFRYLIEKVKIKEDSKFNAKYAANGLFFY